MEMVSTPIYDSVHATPLEGIPTIASQPPRHPDIYRQLCAEYGSDVLAEPGVAPDSSTSQRRPRLGP